MLTGGIVRHFRTDCAMSSRHHILDHRWDRTRGIVFAGGERVEASGGCGMASLSRGLAPGDRRASRREYAVKPLRTLKDVSSGSRPRPAGVTGPVGATAEQLKQWEERDRKSQEEEAKKQQKSLEEANKQQKSLEEEVKKQQKASFDEGRKAGIADATQRLLKVMEALKYKNAALEQEKRALREAQSKDAQSIRELKEGNRALEALRLQDKEWRAGELKRLDAVEQKLKAREKQVRQGEERVEKLWQDENARIDGRLKELETEYNQRLDESKAEVQKEFEIRYQDEIHELRKSGAIRLEQRTEYLPYQREWRMLFQIVEKLRKIWEDQSLLFSDILDRWQDVVEYYGEGNSAFVQSLRSEIVDAKQHAEQTVNECRTRQWELATDAHLSRELMRDMRHGISIPDVATFKLLDNLELSEGEQPIFNRLKQDLLTAASRHARERTENRNQALKVISSYNDRMADLNAHKELLHCGVGTKEWFTLTRKFDADIGDLMRARVAFRQQGRPPTLEEKAVFDQLEEVKETRTMLRDQVAERQVLEAALAAEPDRGEARFDHVLHDAIVEKEQTVYEALDYAPRMLALVMLRPRRRGVKMVRERKTGIVRPRPRPNAAPPVPPKPATTADPLKPTVDPSTPKPRQKRGFRKKRRAKANKIEPPGQSDQEAGTHAIVARDKADGNASGGGGVAFRATEKKQSAHVFWPEFGKMLEGARGKETVCEASTGLRNGRRQTEEGSDWESESNCSAHSVGFERDAESGDGCSDRGAAPSTDDASQQEPPSSVASTESLSEFLTPSSAMSENSEAAPSSESSDDGDRSSQPDEPTPLSYHIPPDDYHVAVMANSTGKATYWTYKLYQNAQGKTPRVHYCTTLEAAQREVGRLQHEPVIGFDLEWEPYSTNAKGDTKDDTKGDTKGDIKRNVSLIQLAVEDKIVLLHLAVFRGDTVDQLIPASLRTLLQSPTTVKAGVNIAGDARRLHDFLGLPMRGCFELSHLYRVVSFARHQPHQVNRRLCSLADQVQTVLLLPLSKGAVRVSHWSRRLDIHQTEYAAADAYAGFRLYHALEAKRLLMRPCPPRPAFWEDNQPLPLGDGRVVAVKPRKPWPPEPVAADPVPATTPSDVEPCGDVFDAVESPPTASAGIPLSAGVTLSGLKPGLAAHNVPRKTLTTGTGR